jgi:pyrroloquinoline-quinone synthase
MSVSVLVPVISPAPVITAMAERVIAGQHLLEARYFTSLADGTMSKDAFIATQQQFFRAADHSPRAMSALIARIPRHSDRLAILHNIVDEHGDFDHAEFHVQSFRNFLASLGSRTDPATVTEWPEIDTFTTLLHGTCWVSPINLAVAFYGVLESAFADVSAKIAQSVIDRGWLPEERIAHYSLHAGIDKEHAAGFFAVAEPHIGEPAERVLVERGLALGMYAFGVLFRDLAIRALDRGARTV